MKLFNKILFSAIIALVVTGSPSLFAAGTTANVSWTAPTAYTSGETLPASDIASYTLSWSGTNPGSKTVTGVSTTVNVPCGTVSFTVAVTTTATAKYPNATSDPAGPVSYASGVTCKPNPPTALQAS